MNKNFKLYSYILDFDDYNRTYIVNSIPSINRDIRIHMLDEIYNLEKSILYAINTKGNITSNNYILILVELSNLIQMKLLLCHL